MRLDADVGLPVLQDQQPDYDILCLLSVDQGAITARRGNWRVASANVLPVYMPTSTCRSLLITGVGVCFPLGPPVR